MADDWQDHVVRTYPDGSKMCWSGGSGHWPCEVSDLRARLAAVEALCAWSERCWLGEGDAKALVSEVRAAVRGDGNRPAEDCLHDGSNGTCAECRLAHLYGEGNQPAEHWIDTAPGNGPNGRRSFCWPCSQKARDYVEDCVIRDQIAAANSGEDDRG